MENASTTNLSHSEELWRVAQFSYSSSRILKLLESKEDLDISNKDGLTILMMCAKNNSFTLFLELLRTKKFDVTKLDNENFSVLDYIVNVPVFGIYFAQELVKHCKEHKIDFKLLGDRNPEFPTMRGAILSGDTDLVDLLINNGYDWKFNTTDYNWVQAAFDSKAQVEGENSIKPMVNHLANFFDITTPGRFSQFVLLANFGRHIEMMEILSLKKAGTKLMIQLFYHASTAQMITLLQMDHTLIVCRDVLGCNLLMMAAENAKVQLFHYILANFPYLLWDLDYWQNDVVHYLNRAPANLRLDMLEHCKVCRLRYHAPFSGSLFIHRSKIMNPPKEEPTSFNAEVFPVEEPTHILIRGATIEEPNEFYFDTRRIRKRPLSEEHTPKRKLGRKKQSTR